jgi:hypothetical protein
MAGNGDRNKMRVPLVAALGVLLFISLFRHISYPLMWNDEAETASFGQSILNHGYPKIHDGKNVLYPLRHPDLSLGEDKKTDAFIGSGWGGFYFSTIGIMAASLSDDLYVKTALMRIPFAILGAGAIALFALAGMAPFRKREDRLLFLAAFLFLELLSVSLALHLREVRYYSFSIAYCPLRGAWRPSPRRHRPGTGSRRLRPRAGRCLSFRFRR